MAPLVRQSWAPRGRTPLLFQRTRSHKKVSAIAAIAISPSRDRVRLYFRLHPDRNIRTSEVVEFLRTLHHHLAAPTIVIWDRLSAHRSKKVQKLIATTPALHTELFPPYAPELNPLEYCWSFLKLNPLANQAFTEVHEIAVATRTHARALQRSEKLLRSFLAHSPLSLHLK
jgi:transposase